MHNWWKKKTLTIIKMHGMYVHEYYVKRIAWGLIYVILSAARDLFFWPQNFRPCGFFIFIEMCGFINLYYFLKRSAYFNPLNAELNPICHLLALLRAHPILHVSRIRVKLLKHKNYFDCILKKYIIAVFISTIVQVEKQHMISAFDLRI